MVSVNGSAAVTRLLSCTWMVKLALVVAVVGVPLTAPVAAVSVTPAGKLPEVTDQVYTPVPPMAVKVCA